MSEKRRQAFEVYKQMRQLMLVSSAFDDYKDVSKCIEFVNNFNYYYDRYEKNMSELDATPKTLGSRIKSFLGKLLK